MPCGLVFRLEIIDLAYTYSIITPRVERQSSHHVALLVKVVSASRLRAQTHARAHAYAESWYYSRGADEYR